MKLLRKIVSVILAFVIAVCLVSCQSIGGDESAKDTTNEKTSETKAADADEQIKDLYIKAKGSLIEPNENIRKEISDAYGSEKGLKWADIESEGSDISEGMRCYGEFENCIVLFESTDLTVESRKTIAGSEFEHSVSFSLYGYHEGTLYALEEAYEKGFISVKDVETAAVRHGNVESYIWYLRGALPAPPSDDALEGLIKAYYDRYSTDAEDENVYFIKKYYGIYDGAVIVLIDGTHLSHDGAIYDKEIGGYYFHHPGNLDVTVYKDNEFYRLQQAYDQGILTKEHIEQLHKTRPITYGNTEYTYPKR